MSENALGKALDSSIDMDKNVVHTGDCLDVLTELPENSIHCVMTSPPYWNLRDYDHEDQIGLEETPEAYVENIAGVMDAVKRVLRPDGSLWLNLGDTYDDKDLQQIPARVALKLQSRGWTLRNRVTWAKPNPMPQSVKDRLNDTTEAIFHFAKNKDYWYDLDAIREPHAESTMERGAGSDYSTKTYTPAEQFPEREPHNKNASVHPAGKNPGDVFEVTTKPFPDAHFAVYPPELCEKPIKATVPPKVCPDCGSPYERDVERKTPDPESLVDEYGHRETSKTEIKRSDSDYMAGKMSGQEWNEWKRNNPDEFKGWTATCDCDTDATERGIVLDLFTGAGTTLLKAKELGRKFVGIELNPKYADMARARVGIDVKDPSNIRDGDGQSGLEAFEVGQ